MGNHNFSLDNSEESDHEGEKNLIRLNCQKRLTEVYEKKFEDSFSFKYELNEDSNNLLQDLLKNSQSIDKAFHFSQNSFQSPSFSNLNSQNMNIENCDINSNSNTNSVINIKFIAKKQSNITNFFQNGSKDNNANSSILNPVNLINIKSNETLDIKNVIARYVQKENKSIEDINSPLINDLLPIQEHKKESLFSNPMNINNIIQPKLANNLDTKSTIQISIQSITKHKTLIKQNESNGTIKKERDIEENKSNKGSKSSTLSDNCLITKFYSKKLGNQLESINPTEVQIVSLLFHIGFI